MTLHLRRAIFACALFILLLLLALVIRFDPETIGPQALETLQRELRTSIAFDTSALSFLHGFSIRVTGLNVRDGAGGFQLKAHEAYLEISPLSLLRGGAEVQGIYLVSARISAASPNALLAFHDNHPIHLERFNIRKGKLVIGGKPILDDLLVDLRGIGKERLMRWEIRGLAEGNNVESRGEAEFDMGRILRAFGKIRIEKAPLEPWLGRPFFQAYTHARVVCTFDADAQGSWHVSGDVRLTANSDTRPAIDLRGKLDFVQGRWQWREVIVQTAGHPQFKTQGECNKGVCQANIEGSRMDLSQISAAIFGHMELSGRLRFHGELKRKEKTFRLDGMGDLKDVRFHDLLLPPMNLELEGLHISDDGIRLNNATLRHASLPGNLRIEGLIQGREDWELEIRLHKVRDWWTHLYDVVTLLHDKVPHLSGRGVLAGVFAATHKGPQTDLRFDFDANKAEIALFGFYKPLGIPFLARGGWRFSPKEIAIDLDHVRLDDSAVANFHYRRNGNQAERVQASTLNIDFNRMLEHGARLLKPFHSMHGAIQGSNVQWERPGGLLNGSFALQAWGLGPDRFDGLINVKKGKAFSQQLVWQRGQDRLTLSGWFHFNRREGNLDVIDGVVHWDPGYRSVVAGLHLSGRLSLNRLAIDGIDLDDVSAEYRLEDALLSCRRFKATWGGGELISPLLEFGIGSSPPFLKGRLQASNVVLDKIKPVLSTFPHTVRGTLFATIYLEGSIPPRSLRDLSGNGEIAVFSGTLEGIDMLARLGLGESTGKATSFRRLAFRFNLQKNGLLRFDRLRFHANHVELHGSGTLEPSGRLRARLKALLAGEERMLHIERTGFP